MSNTDDSDATEFLESQSQDNDANSNIAKPDDAERTADQAKMFNSIISPDSKKGKYSCLVHRRQMPFI